MFRDHSKPCEHGKYLRCFGDGPTTRTSRDPMCPGGREVTINYEAAYSEAGEWIGRMVRPDDLADAILNAALGGDNE